MKTWNTWYTLNAKKYNYLSFLYDFLKKKFGNFTKGAFADPFTPTKSICITLRSKNNLQLFVNFCCWYFHIIPFNISTKLSCKHIKKTKKIHHLYHIFMTKLLRKNPMLEIKISWRNCTYKNVSFANKLLMFYGYCHTDKFDMCILAEWVAPALCLASASSQDLNPD